MVRWNAPKTLLQAALSAATSAVFARFADKREVQAGLCGAEFDGSGPAALDGEGSFWLDFVADVGDGFDSTYTIAWLLAQERLRLSATGSEHDTERGRLLFLGGDAVYPAANWDDYQERFVTPYKAALPYVRGRHPRLFAIPGNHDWYDGLTSFMRLFCQEQWIGGWQTQQRRSYFAVRLPRRWWVWGIDIQLDTYIDEPQLAYFERIAAELLEEGDRVILVTSKPSWTRAEDDPEPQSWRTLTYFEQRMIREHGGVPALTITGDLHHYCHYEVESAGEPRHRVTSGGGGAYLYGTHSMPDRICLRSHGSDHRVRYRRVAEFPEIADSRELARGVLRLVNPFHRHPMGHVTGPIYALFALVLAAGVKDQTGNLLDAVRAQSFAGLLRDSVTLWAVLLAVLLWRLLYGLAEVDPAHRRSARTRRVAYSVLHTAGHLAPIVVVTATVLWAASKAGRPEGGFWAGYATAVLIYFFGRWWGRTVLVLYYYEANRKNPRQHINDAFAAQAIADYKGFVRMRIGADGELTVFPVGVREVVKDWKAKPRGSGDELLEPWFEPASGREPQPELIEEPFTAG